jgi:hypothetical protein
LLLGILKGSDIVLNFLLVSFSTPDHFDVREDQGGAGFVDLGEGLGVVGLSGGELGLQLLGRGRGDFKDLRLGFSCLFRVRGYETFLVFLAFHNRDFDIIILHLTIVKGLLTILMRVDQRISRDLRPHLHRNAGCRVDRDVAGRELT